MPIPPNEWNIGKIIIKEKKWGFPSEYEIRITKGGIDIEKNGERLMRLRSWGFVDYHISSLELIIKYDKSQNILYNGEEGYGPNQLRIPIQYFSDDDKESLCALMRRVDGWKKDKYAFVYGNPKKVKSEVGNEGMIAMGRGYLKWGNAEKAEKTAKEALEIHLTLDGYLLLMDAYKAKKDEVALRAYAKEALDNYPMLDCYLFLLDMYKEMNDEAAFRVTCEEALRHIDNAEERAILNEKIENSSQINENKCEVKEKTMELTMHVWCQFGIGQGFDFDVNLTENEIRELAREFLNDEDAYHDFETIKRRHETLYNKIRSMGRDALYDKIGEDAIKNDIIIAWGDEADRFFETNFRDCKIYI